MEQTYTVTLHDTILFMTRIVEVNAANEDEVKREVEKKFSNNYRIVNIKERE